MRGHVMFEWEQTPARLAIWTMRVIRVGRHECPGLHSVLSEHLGDDAHQAIQATQVLTFVMHKGRELSGAAEPFSSTLEDNEKLTIAALEALAKDDRPAAWAAAEKIAGVHSAIAMGALSDLAAIYKRRGLMMRSESDAPARALPASAILAD